MNYKKILILGPIPYSKNLPSRSYNSLFAHYPKENLKQIYTSNSIPVKGHCSSFYRLTDKEMFYNKFFNAQKYGTTYNEQDLSSGEILRPKNRRNSLASNIINNSSFGYKLRNFIWSNNAWKNSKIINWIDDFNPDFIFLDFPKQEHLLNLAIEISSTKKIPIITMFYDDFILNYKKGPIFNKIQRSYKNKYMKIFSNKANLFIFNNEKMMKKYTQYFKLENVSTIYIASENKICNAKPIQEIKKICYFGNLYIGRFNTILSFAKNIKKSNISIDVFTSSINKKMIKKIKQYPNIHLFNAIPYESIIKKITEYDATLFIETLDKIKYINFSKYSLSTKIGDYLSYNIPIIAIGNEECGSIGFFVNNHFKFVFKTKDEINDFNKYAKNELNILVKEQLDLQHKIFLEKFTLKETTSSFLKLINRYK